MIAFYKRMDHLVVVNPSFISKLINYGIPKNKISYIPNFVSQSEFYPQSNVQKKKFKKKLNIDKKFVVLGVGQIQKRKGINDFVLLALKNPNIQFIWAGGFSFGKLTDGFYTFNKIVNNPPHNLIFTGIVKREELVNYYNIADLFLLPSYNELFPMSVLEAFNCHTPVLLRDLDLYKSIINSYYMPASNVKEMNELIHKLSNNKDELLCLKNKSIKGASYYSEKKLSEYWENFYQKQAIYNV